MTSSTITTAAQLAGTCAVPPSPELLDRWAAQLKSQTRRSKSDDGAPIGLQREPRRLGLNDGVIVPPEQYPVGTPVRTIRAAAADRAPLRGTVRVAVVLVDFSDKAMTTTTTHINDLFFSSGVLPHGSVKEFYSEATGGLVTLDGVVVGPYRMPQTLAWYANGGYGLGQFGTAFRSPQLAHDAAAAADAAVNFGPYDNDGNGFVDAFIVVHAGSGAEVTGSKGDIWSHKSVMNSAYSTDGTQIYGYLTIPEDAKIGVSAHELGHLLFGFPDLYDTDYSSEGIGNWCLMAGGTWNGGGEVPAHPSAWCKVNQGWVSTTVVTANGGVTVSAVETSRQVFRLWTNGASGSEYFLLENRQPIGFDADLPGSGLLLWHIDEAQSGNTDENHYKVALVQADGHRDLELKHNRGDAGDPFPGSGGVTSVSASTTPNTKSYAGADTCVSVTSIPASSAAMTVQVTVRCKAVIKDIKDARKELKDGKELRKDIKDARKEIKDGKEIKEFRKELIKEHIKDVAEKGQLKDVKEAVKEVKEAAKEIFERPGGGLDGGWRQRAGQVESATLDERVAVLEAIVSALAGDGAVDDGAGFGDSQPFIGADLRPDLMGASGGFVADPTELEVRMNQGDVDAKRQFDTPPR